MPAGWIAAIGAVIGVGLSAYEYASAPGMPKPPDLNAASREQVEAESAALPDRLRLEAAAQQGTSTQYNVAAFKGKEKQQFVSLPSETHGRMGELHTQLVPYVPSEWEPGGKYASFGTPKIITKNVKVNRPGETRTADFTGYGTADVQGAIARKNAQSQLDLEKKFGPQFIAEALKEEALANPEGKAARDRSLELIKEQEANHPDRPVAKLLDSQVAEQLHAGRGLDRMSSQVLRDAVAQAQAERGGSSNSLDYSEPLTTGSAGEARLSAANQKALSWLSSGATPEDVEYRRREQDLSNLGAFVNGQTPQSQFQTLSGAQTGPAPFYQGAPQASLNPNSGAAANNAALSNWGTQNAFNATQTSPWIAGLSLALNGASAAGKAGWKPLG